MLERLARGLIEEDVTDEGEIFRAALLALHV